MRRLALVLLMFLAGCGTARTDTQTTPTATATTEPPTAATAPSQCHATNPSDPAHVLPDRLCTPGAINPNVTQANVKSTVCVKGWTATIRPPASYTTALKVRQIAQYGYSDKRLSHYEEDHLISLELGGNPTDPRNLWPEPGGVPNPKDRVENALRAEVCAGKLPLATAQREISANWTTAK